jgi:peptidoglycan/LPS O-acetylase OafA/YrhL
MALILSEKYTNNITFFKNRFLKIYPIYWLVLLLSLIYEILNLYFNSSTQNIFAFFNPDYSLQTGTFLFLGIPNITIFGLDLTFLFRLTGNGGLAFTSNFRQFVPPLYSFNLIAQAWTLSLELTFYLFAPFLNKLKNKYLLLIMALSLGLRLFLYSQGLNHDPWTYRFLPNEIIFFLSGILMYRIYRYIKDKNTKLFSLYSFFFYFSFLIYYQFLPHQRTKQIILFLFSFIFIPFIFNLFKKNRTDRFIGELSYPIYISHFLIINTLTHFTQLNHQYLGIVTTLISIIFSIFLYRLVVVPIDRYRQKQISPHS